MRKKQQLGLVIDALVLLREMQERLSPHEGLSDVSAELTKAINRLETFLARTDKSSAGWWEEFRSIVDMLLTLLRIYLDFLRH